ncbi:methyltransferase domain-containing protein [Colletotrichum cereale]|nr:methyltransferase domain-containing protein [Colletotrichum cereale]
MEKMAMRPNRRVLQMFWLATAVVFVFAILHLRSGQVVHSVSEWTSSKVSNLVNMHGSRKTMAKFMARSESVWTKTVNQRHEMIAADWGDASKMPLYSAVEAASYGAHPYTVWDFMPASYNCPWDVERIGRMGDGGKWVCGMSRYEDYPKDRECVIYSFGVRDESSFEQEMLSRTNCVVWAYDFSVVDFGTQVDSKNRDRAHFKQVGIAGTTDTTRNPPFYSIADLMEMNGHDYVDILKMDIEKAEFDALDGMHRDFPLSVGEELPIGQLMIEIHLSEDTNSKTLLDWWERLEAHGLRAAWTEPNLLAVTMQVCHKDPCMAEYTMINVHDTKSILFEGA